MSTVSPDLPAAALKEVGPHCEISFRKGRRFDHAQSVRNRQTQRRRGDGILSVAAARQQCGDLVADRQSGRVRPQRDDVAGDLETWNIGRAGRRRIVSLPLHDVGPVDSRCGDPHQHFPRRRAAARAGPQSSAAPARRGMRSPRPSFHQVRTFTSPGSNWRGWLSSIL